MIHHHYTLRLQVPSDRPESMLELVGIARVFAGHEKWNEFETKLTDAGSEYHIFREQEDAEIITCVNEFLRIELEFDARHAEFVESTLGDVTEAFTDQCAAELECNAYFAQRSNVDLGWVN